jgi:PAS domain S-box-containing protein
MNVKDIQDSTILLVDDNPETLAPLGEYLKIRGFSVCSVENGKQALDISQRNQPDIILLDVLMPGMTGFDVCRHLKMHDDTKDIPVVFMSALTETVDKITGFDVGGVDYITKPFEYEEVVARISAHLRLRYLQKSLQQNNARLLREVDQRMQVEQALRESEQYARNIIESSLNMIIAVDKDRQIVEFNKAAEEAFGYTRKEVVGKNVSILYADREEASTIGQTMIEQTQSIREVYNKRKNGEVFPCLLSASTLRDTQGEVIGYMGISRDITELKRAQAELLAAHNELKEKNEQLQELNVSKDKFFSIISHDLRGSFGTLLGFAQLITENIDDYSKDRVKAFVLRLRASAERLYALLENLLTWSRIQRRVMKCLPKPINLAAIARENIELFAPQAEKKQIMLSNAIPQEMIVYADQSMVDTVIRNLVSNALKFTQAEGHVELSATKHEADSRFIAISVSDTGIGIPEEMLPRLLRLDMQYKTIGTAGEQGSGLGLILCKELVEQHGGELWVTSEVDKGTTFSFTLPKPPDKAS